MNVPMQQTAPRPKAKFVGDREGSTYRWELFLSGNGYIFDGYSKNKGQAEKMDKQALFQDCVARILNSGYLDKTYQMLWYKREFMHKSQDKLLLEMYPTHCVAHNELKFDISTLKFLERIYMARQTGLGLDYKEFLPPRQSKRDVEADHFKFSLQRFPTAESLYKHCEELSKIYPRIRVENWWRSVQVAYEGQPIKAAPGKVMYFGNGQQEPLQPETAPAQQPSQPAPTPQPQASQRPAPTTPPMPPARPGQAPAPNMDDPDNQQSRANAQQTINGLYVKFNVNK